MPTEQIVTELLPCPFCGATNDGFHISVTVSHNLAGAVAGHMVECDQCASFGPDKPSEAEAIAAWNHRLQQPIGGTAREVLVGAAEIYHPSVAEWLKTSPALTNTPYELALRAIQSVLDREAGLRAALGNWKCPSCGGSRVYKNKFYNAEDDELVSEELDCKVCASTGLHPTAAAVLSPVPIEAGEVEPEQRAWTWLDAKFGEPADRDYSADEMVDAFMAGRSSAPSASSEVDREAVIAVLARNTPSVGKALPAIADEILALRQPTGNSRVEFQERVQPWMMACFGPEISADRVERGDRFAEEAFELLQAGGYDPARLTSLIAYVWKRPVGDPAQEVGGVMVTLAAYCLAHGLDMHMAGEDELARINRPEIIEKIRVKQAAKARDIPFSPLPQVKP